VVTIDPNLLTSTPLRSLIYQHLCAGEPQIFRVQNNYTSITMTESPMRTAVAAFLIFSVIGAVSLRSMQQAPPVTFKVEISYVDVDVVVTDAQGNVVTGLTKDDFDLFEDGHPQNIDMFTPVDIPMLRQDRFL